MYLVIKILQLKNKKVYIINRETKTNLLKHKLPTILIIPSDQKEEHECSYEVLRIPLENEINTEWFTEGVDTICTECVQDPSNSLPEGSQNEPESFEGWFTAQDVEDIDDEKK